MNTPVNLNRTAAVHSIIESVLDGKPLKEAIKAVEITPYQFNAILQSDRELALAYARATELRGDLLADELIPIADSNEDPAKVRNQIQVRQWLASKLNKKYGDRVDLNVTQTIDVGSTLMEARKRLSMRDQLEPLDLGSEQYQEIEGNGATDNKSESPGTQAPDIFS